jgi:hypothetical protein
MTNGVQDLPPRQRRLKPGQSTIPADYRWTHVRGRLCGPNEIRVTKPRLETRHPIAQEKVHGDTRPERAHLGRLSLVLVSRGRRAPPLLAFSPFISAEFGYILTCVPFVRILERATLMCR